MGGRHRLLRSAVVVERHALLAVGLRPRSGRCLPFVGMSFALLLVDQPLIEFLDQCTSMTVNVVALVLPEPYLLTLGALFIHLLLHRCTLCITVVVDWCFHFFITRLHLLLGFVNLVNIS